MVPCCVTESISSCYRPRYYEKNIFTVVIKHWVGLLRTIFQRVAQLLYWLVQCNTRFLGLQKGEAISKTSVSHPSRFLGGISARQNNKPHLTR